MKFWRISFPNSLGLILDTACRKTISGSRFQDEINANLRADFGLSIISQPETEMFVFGPTKPITSHSRARIPVGISGFALEVRSSTVPDSPLPLLASLELQRNLGVVIDTESGTASFRRLGVKTLKLFWNPDGTFSGSYR